MWRVVTISCLQLACYRQLCSFLTLPCVQVFLLKHSLNAFNVMYSVDRLLILLMSLCSSKAEIAHVSCTIGAAVEVAGNNVTRLAAPKLSAD